MRPLAPGDPLKRVNWRASARRGELWVNESHPERNTDVILFVDSFAEARLGGEGTLDLAVRATAALADAYVGRRDRVGLIGFGGILRWLVPGTGIVQLYRIVDALLDTQIVLSYYWKEIDVIPRRTLPPNALVIALSPLLDPRSVGALLDLRARGFDLAVIDVSPVPFTPRPERAARRARLRHLDASPRRAAPPPAARRRRGRRVARPTRRCRPSSRRCGHSGATPGTRAPDHRRRRARSRSAARRLRGVDRAAGSRRRDRHAARSPSRCSRSALVLRWPQHDPVGGARSPAPATSTAREGHDRGRRLGGRRRRRCSCSRPSSRRGRSSTTPGSARSRRSRFVAR